MAGIIRTRCSQTDGIGACISGSNGLDHVFSDRSLSAGNLIAVRIIYSVAIGGIRGRAGLVQRYAAQQFLHAAGVNEAGICPRVQVVELDGKGQGRTHALRHDDIALAVATGQRTCDRQSLAIVAYFGCIINETIIEAAPQCNPFIAEDRVEGRVLKHQPGIVKVVSFFVIIGIVVRFNLQPGGVCLIDFRTKLRLRNLHAVQRGENLHAIEQLGTGICVLAGGDFGGALSVIQTVFKRCAVHDPVAQLEHGRADQRLLLAIVGERQRLCGDLVFLNGEFRAVEGGSSREAFINGTRRIILIQGDANLVRGIGGDAAVHKAGGIIISRQLFAVHLHIVQNIRRYEVFLIENYAVLQNNPNGGLDLGDGRIQRLAAFSQHIVCRISAGKGQVEGMCAYVGKAVRRSDGCLFPFELADNRYVLIEVGQAVGFAVIGHIALVIGGYGHFHDGAPKHSRHSHIACRHGKHTLVFFHGVIALHNSEGIQFVAHIRSDGQSDVVAVVGDSCIFTVYQHADRAVFRFLNGNGIIDPFCGILRINQRNGIALAHDGIAAVPYLARAGIAQLIEQVSAVGHGSIHAVRAMDDGDGLVVTDGGATGKLGLFDGAVVGHAAGEAAAGDGAFVFHAADKAAAGDGAVIINFTVERTVGDGAGLGNLDADNFQAGFRHGGNAAGDDQLEAAAACFHMPAIAVGQGKACLDGGILRNGEGKQAVDNELEPVIAVDGEAVKDIVLIGRDGDVYFFVFPCKRLIAFQLAVFGFADDDETNGFSGIAGIDQRNGSIQISGFIAAVPSLAFAGIAEDLAQNISVERGIHAVDAVDNLLGISAVNDCAAGELALGELALGELAIVVHGAGEGAAGDGAHVQVRNGAGEAAAGNGAVVDDIFIELAAGDGAAILNFNDLNIQGYRHTGNAAGDNELIAFAMRLNMPAIAGGEVKVNIDGDVGCGHGEAIVAVFIGTGNAQLFFFSAGGHDDLLQGSSFRKHKLQHDGVAENILLLRAHLVDIFALDIDGVHGEIFDAIIEQQAIRFCTLHATAEHFAAEHILHRIVGIRQGDVFLFAIVLEGEVDAAAFPKGIVLGIIDQLGKLGNIACAMDVQVISLVFPSGVEYVAILGDCIGAELGAAAAAGEHPSAAQI